MNIELGFIKPPQKRVNNFRKYKESAQALQQLFRKGNWLLILNNHPDTKLLALDKTDGDGGRIDH